MKNSIKIIEIQDAKDKLHLAYRTASQEQRLIIEEKYKALDVEHNELLSRLKNRKK